MVELFTRPYFDELANRLNDDAEFQKKAGNLTTNLLMTCRDKSRSFLLKIEKGKASVADATPETPADFGFSADYAQWVANHKGETSLEKAIMSGKVKFKGSMAKILGVRSQLQMIDSISQKVPAEY